MSAVEGNWYLPPAEGCNHRLGQTIIEVNMAQAVPPGLAWLRFVVPAPGCPSPHCPADLPKDGIGAYIYRRGEPWIVGTIVIRGKDYLRFMNELEWPIDDLPWAVSDGTEATARAKLYAYLEFSGGVRDSDVFPEVAKIRKEMEERLVVQS